MPKKVGVFVALVALGLVALGLAAPDFTVSIAEDKAQAAVRERLPKEISRLGAKITIETVDLDFRDDNKVGVGVLARAEGFGFGGHAEVKTVSGIRYDAGKFYLSDLVLNDIRFTPDPPASAAIADRQMVVQGALAAMRNGLNDSKAESGDAFDREQQRLLERLKPIAVGLLQDSLRSIPIYDLTGKDLKRDVAAMALKDVRFSGDAAHVVLSSRQFVGTVLYYAACGLLIALALAMFVYGHMQGPQSGRRQSRARSDTTRPS
jgi:hypothetical protein